MPIPFDPLRLVILAFLVYSDSFERVLLRLLPILAHVSPGARVDGRPLTRDVSRDRARGPIHSACGVSRMSASAWDLNALSSDSFLCTSASNRRSLTIIMFNEHKARNTKQGVTGYVVC